MRLGCVAPCCCRCERCLFLPSVICRHSGLSRHGVRCRRLGDCRRFLRRCVVVYEKNFLRWWSNLARIVERRFFFHRLVFLRRRLEGGLGEVPGRCIFVWRLDGRSRRISGCALGTLCRTKNDGLFQFHGVRPLHFQVRVVFRSASVGMEKCVCKVCLIFGAVLLAVIVPLLLFVAVPASLVPEIDVGPSFFWRIPSVAHNWWNRRNWLFWF